jgi:uroporphyrinogen decarboxylase
MPASTPRERVQQAIRHTQPDCVPYHFSFTTLARQKLEAYYGTPDLDAVLDNHIAKYKPRCDDYLENVGPDLWRDEFGVIWNRQGDADIGSVVNCVLETRSLAGYTFPDPHRPCRYTGLPAFIVANRDRFRVINLGKSLFERAWSMRGMENILIDMLEAPEWVEGLLDAIADFNMGNIGEVVKYDIDAVMFGDDWGAQRGLLFSPRLWRRLIKPRLGRMYSAVKQAGKAVFIHSCGKVQELFPELIELGVDVFNPFQPEVMDLYKIKRQYGQHLSFYGGMSIQRVLPFGTPQEVKEEAYRLMDEIGRGGGYIMAPSHDMPGDIPVENMLAFIEAVRDQ